MPLLLRPPERNRDAADSRDALRRLFTSLRLSPECLTCLRLRVASRCMILASVLETVPLLEVRRLMPVRHPVLKRFHWTDPRFPRYPQSESETGLAPMNLYAHGGIASMAGNDEAAVNHEITGKKS